MTVYPTYRVSEKVLLEHGDKFRASKGPYYMTAGGVKINMAERGKMIFVDYYEEHGNKVIRALQGGCMVNLILKRGPKRLVEGMKYRAYKLTKCRVKKDKIDAKDKPRNARAKKARKPIVATLFD